MKSVISRWNFDTPASLLHIDDRISNIEGVSVMPADGHDSFLSCYLPSKITCPPAQYPLLFSTRGKQAERGPHARLSGCISISRPALISKINWQWREIFKFLTQDVTIILSPHLLHQNSRWKLFSVSEIVTFSVIHQMLIACAGTCGPPRSEFCESSSPGRWPPDGSRWGAQRSRSPFHHQPADRPSPPRCPPPPLRKHRHHHQILAANLVLTKLFCQPVCVPVSGWLSASILNLLI